MKDNWLFRLYQNGDERLITSFYNTHNDKPMSLASWKWKFRDNPSGQAIIAMLFDGCKLIGHRVAMPMNLLVGGKVVKAAITVNNLTHPDYRKQGIAGYLGERLYDEAKQQKIDLIYNYPQPNTYGLYGNLGGWSVLDKRSVWHKTIMDTMKSNSLTIEPIKEFDSQIDKLWNEVKDNYKVVVPRTSQWLNWRYANHPTVNYPKYVVVNSKHEVVGYIVLKIYANDNAIKGHIIDIQCLNEKHVMHSLLNCTYRYFAERGIRNLTCWMPQQSFYGDMLTEAGFYKEETETLFGVILFNQELQQVKQIENWHLTMGDADYF